MDRGEGTQEQGGFEFEVKEQDRWLPIANGQFSFYAPVSVCDTLICAVSNFLHLSTNAVPGLAFHTPLQTSPHPA